MANLATSLNQARAVSGDKAAARLYNSIEHELALGAGGSEEDYEQGEEALAVLRERYPSVEGQARTITAPPELSRRAKRTIEETSPEHGTRRRRATSRTPRSTGATRRAPRTGTQTAGRVSSAAGNAIDWASDTDAGSLIGWMFMYGVGLSVFYLLITHNKAVSKLGLGATNVARAVISPHIDPLNPGRSL